MLNFCTSEDIQGSITVTMGNRFANSFALVQGAVTAKFNRYLRRNFDLTTGITVQFGKYGVRNQKTFLGYRFIDPSSFVLVYDRDYDFASASPLDPSTYRLDIETGRLEVSSQYVTAENGYQATFNAGIAQGNEAGCFDFNTLPANLRFAAIKQSLWEMSKLAGGSTGDQQTVTRGNGRSQAVDRVKLVDGLLPDVASDLNEFRRPLISNGR